MAILRRCIGCFVFFGFVLFGATAGVAYESYNDGCDSCHGSFKSTDTTKTNNTWPDKKHDVHREVMLEKDAVSGVNPKSCVFCHNSLGGSVNNDPLLNQSDGDPAFGIPGIGCTGCHARFYATAAKEVGAGLRAHHALNAVTCSDSQCHTTPDPTPLPESVKPRYYGLPGVNITDPCLPKGTVGDGSENFTSDTIGNDNDGDDLYELADSDCVAGTPDIQLMPSTLAFASVAISGSKDLTTQVQNLGTADLNVSSISLCAGTSAEYSWSPVSAFTVAAAGNQVLTVTYAPVDAGQDNGCLSISSNDPDEDPIELTLSGEGVACTPDLVLANQVINQAAEFIACNSITLGPTTQIIQGNFRAGETVEFVSDVEAQEMTVTIDPSLIPPP